MKIEFTNELDIKAYLVYSIAIICALLGKIDWIIAILFILSNITLKWHFGEKTEELEE